MPAYAQATYSITDDTRLTAGVRYTMDQRDAYMDTTTIRTPATAGDQHRGDQWRLQSGRLQLSGHHLCRPDRRLRPHQR